LFSFQKISKDSLKPKTDEEKKEKGKKGPADEKREGTGFDVMKKDGRIEGGGGEVYGKDEEGEKEYTEWTSEEENTVDAEVTRETTVTFRAVHRCK